MEREGHKCLCRRSPFLLHSELFTGAKGQHRKQQCNGIVACALSDCGGSCPFLLLTQLRAFLLVQNLAFKLHVSFLVPLLCSPRPVTFMLSTSLPFFRHTSLLNGSCLVRYGLLCAFGIFTWDIPSPLIPCWLRCLLSATMREELVQLGASLSAGLLTALSGLSYNQRALTTQEHANLFLFWEAVTAGISQLSCKEAGVIKVIPWQGM